MMEPSDPAGHHRIPRKSIPMPSPRLDGPLVVFVDIDTQRDFLEPGGSLFIAESTAILPNLARLTAFARDKGIPVIATSCAHAPDAAEFAVFPPHCVLGTRGQERVEATDWPGGTTLPLGETLASSAALPDHLTLHKDAYDLFSRDDAPAVFARYAASGATFVVYGVATDYCVKSAVEGLIDRGYPTALVVDAIRAVRSADEPAILTGLAGRGVLLTLTDVVVGPRRP
jgi:nicotinamidase/pyrazinamidase